MDHFGVSENYATITDRGVINVLIAMEYLKEESLSLQEYMTVLENREIREQQDRALAAVTLN